jgi:hypothetical protein
MGRKFVVPKKYVGDRFPIEQEIIVPSTKDVDKPVSDAEIRRRVKKVKDFLSKKFGGYTSDKELGGYYSEDKDKVIQEPVTTVTSYAKKSKFQKNRKELMQQLGKWAKKWGQESVGYELEGDLYYVKPVNKKISKSKVKQKIKNKKVIPKIRRMNRMQRIRNYK